MPSDFESLTERLARADFTNKKLYDARVSARQWIDQLLKALKEALDAHENVDEKHLSKKLRDGMKQTRESLLEQYEFALVAYGCLINDRGLRPNNNPPPYWGPGVQKEYLEVLCDAERRAAALESLVREHAVDALARMPGL